MCENGKRVGDFDSGFDLVERYDSCSEKRLNFISLNSSQQFRKKPKVMSGHEILCACHQQSQRVSSTPVESFISQYPRVSSTIIREFYQPLSESFMSDVRDLDCRIRESFRQPHEKGSSAIIREFHQPLSKSFIQHYQRVSSVT